MKLTEALQILKDHPRGGARPFRVSLGCGFSPLHLSTFLAAHLARRLPDRQVALESGIYGDLPGNIGKARGERGDGACVVVEWPDLDARLGMRQLGRWSLDALDDILVSARQVWDALERSIADLAEEIPVALALPTLPLPPVSHAPGWQASALESGLRGLVAAGGCRLQGRPGIRLLNVQRLDRDSPPAARLDPASEIRHGFPYAMGHADALANLLALLLAPPAPKKGLITDLDDTLWMGTLGEDGEAGIHWDLDRGGHRHGLYQRMLDALASAGVLVAVASRNDPDLAGKALKRPDLLIPGDQFFPVEAGWGPKSDAVARILRAWNIGAGDVVFVDNQPSEVAEVQLAHPGICGVTFPEREAEVWALLGELRDLFGKPAVTGEDALRLQSLRAGAEFQAGVAGEGTSAEQFLAQADARISWTLRSWPADPRALELVNKTNQFNLNGRRFGEQEWRVRLEAPQAFLGVFSYEDKYGRLGKIAVVGGRKQGRRLEVDVWVMSCRAFSRRVEHQCLLWLFHGLDVDEISFAYAPSGRNRVFLDFLDGVAARDLGGTRVLGRQAFEQACPPLYHRMEEASHD